MMKTMSQSTPGALPAAGAQRAPGAALPDEEADEVFVLAAETFRVMSSPVRLKIIRSLCNGEKNVSELIHEIDITQPNMSQHLNTLYQARVVGKRKDGVQIFYRLIDERVATLCRAVCTHIAIGPDLGS